jgi:hypothetical protein
MLRIPHPHLMRAASCLLLVSAFGIATSCGSGAAGGKSFGRTQAALEHGVHGRCQALTDDGHRWRCRLEDDAQPTMTITIDDRGAWSGETQTAPGPPQTVTMEVDGRKEVGTTGDFTTGHSVFGCCVPLP